MPRPLAVLKSTGPKLVPFFKTLAIYYVLFGGGSRMETVYYSVFKVLPVVSLMVFVLLHGMDFSEVYSYSRKILMGLVSSAVGDVMLVWRRFLPGVACFALAQILYACAFGFRPLELHVGLSSGVLAAVIYAVLLPGLQGVYVYMVGLYTLLIFVMAWRAISRVPLPAWTWTKLCSCGGACFFVLSDVIIAFNKFYAPVPYSHQLIMSTYYAAQLGIALSVVDSHVTHRDVISKHLDSHVTHSDASSKHVDSHVTHSDGICKHVDSHVTHSDGICKHVDSHVTHSDGICKHVDSHVTHSDGICKHVDSHTGSQRPAANTAQKEPIK